MSSSALSAKMMEKLGAVRTYLLPPLTISDRAARDGRLVSDRRSTGLCSAHVLRVPGGPSEVGGGNFLSDTSPEASAAELRALPAAHHGGR